MKKSSYKRFRQWLKITIYRQLIRPLIHSKATPEYKARGVAVGLAWAFTPLVGIQMGLVAFTWGIAHRFQWKFSLPLALAWTWVTNVVTMVPIYYVFYVIGQILRFKWDDISGYDALSRLIERVFLSDKPFLVQMKEFFTLFVQDWGVSLFLGCIPFVIISYIYGYKWTLRYELMRLKKKQQRRKK